MLTTYVYSHYVYSQLARSAYLSSNLGQAYKMYAFLSRFGVSLVQNGITQYNFNSRSSQSE